MCGTCVCEAGDMWQSCEKQVMCVAVVCEAQVTCVTVVCEAGDMWQPCSLDLYLPKPDYGHLNRPSPSKLANDATVTKTAGR